MPDNFSPERRAALERERSQSGGRQGFYDFKNLTTDMIRLLPLGQTESIGTKWIYYFLNKKGYTCNMETHGIPGIICKTIAALERLGTEEALAMVVSLKDARRAKWLMKIISRKDPTTPKWMESPFAIYKVALDAFVKDEEDISDSKAGRDLRISVEGAGRTKKYSAVPRDRSPIAETVEERKALRKASEEMVAARLTVANESGAKEALMGVIPPHLWAKIKGEVLGAAAAASDTGPRRASNDDDDDAPSQEAAEVAPVKAKAKPAPVDPDEDEAPAPKPAKKAPAAPVDEDDEAPVAPAPKPAKKAPAVVDDDEEAPPAPKPAKKATPAPAVVDDDDEGPARTPANRRSAVVVDEEIRAPAKRQKIEEDPDA